MRLLKNYQDKFGDKGVALPFVALMLTLLLGMTALAVDLGWLYLNGSRVQRGADAAALAAVVHLPHNNAGVDSNTIDGANANGWNVGTLNGSPISGGGPDVAEWRPLSDNRLEVRLTATVPTFFMRVLGMDEVTISRRATAEYIKPVPMGSPSACFGMTPFVTGISGSQSLSNQGLASCAAWNMNFWAAINGPRTAKHQGDPYSALCLTANSSGCTGGSNSEYRATGYYYGIEVPASSNKTSITVKAFDAGYYARSNPQTETGDFHSTLGDSNQSSGPRTEYRLFAPDDTPLDPTDNGNQLCSRNFDPVNGTGSTSRNQWNVICTISNPDPGIYVLNVRTTGTGGGMNAYSLGVSGDPNNSGIRTYAINDMSIFTNSGGASTATVYLAEVGVFHSGKTLVLDFFDPGENPQGDAWVEVRRPSGTGSASAACVWSATNGASSGGDSINPCLIQSTVGGTAQFNGEWLHQTINIPSSYSCGTFSHNGQENCYWTMRLQLGDTSQDRTTWAARVIGNPVRLVPNDPTAAP